MSLIQAPRVVTGSYFYLMEYIFWIIAKSRFFAMEYWPRPFKWQLGHISIPWNIDPVTLK